MADKVRRRRRRGGLVLVSKQVQHTEEGREEGRGRDQLPWQHYTTHETEAVLAFGLSSDSINKEVVCIIHAYWLPRETEEEEPVLFGRL